MQGFEYLSPATTPEALRLLGTYRDRARLLAGGTDLLVQMEHNEVRPHYVIDLKRIRELQGIRHSPDGGLAIYSLTRLADLASMEGLNGSFSILREAAQTVGSVQIRNRATIGGNICRAAPSADLVPALLVLDAKIRMISAEHERWVALDGFFVGPGRTTLQPHELLAEVQIPPPPPGGGGIYQKLGPRQTMDLATVGVAVFLQMDSGAAISNDIRIALASVAPTPIRAREAERMLIGNPLTPPLIAQAARQASLEANPITDVYGPDWYKRQMIEVLTKRTICEAMARVRGWM
ncbi:MAG: xanthine dehydrogenase family protein subunit M [Deltaproteobacteria bacterium]|nr:xanthine dehydrogenase family protein subunit M [Deltaproteobacteria bacterium]